MQSHERSLRTIENLEDLMQFVVKFAPNGVRAAELASLVGKNHQVLLNEVNPARDDHKLGVQLVLPLCREAGALHLLALVAAREAGGRFVALDRAPAELSGGSPMEVMDRNLGAYEALDKVTARVRTSLADGRLTPGEIKELTHAIWNCAEALMVLDTAAKVLGGEG